METIKQYIHEGRIDEAIQQLDHYISTHNNSDEAYYLRGNAYRKKGDMRQALNNYLQAIEINPESPAVQAHNMLIDILNFYDKSRYNP